jgi:ribosomal protein S15P/S13E
MANFVEIKENKSTDYYGGYENLAHYEGRINEILDYLKQNNLLENEK